MEDIEKLANEILANDGEGATGEMVDGLGQGESPLVSDALRKVVLNEQNPEKVREKALNYLMVMVSRAISARRIPGEISEETMDWIEDLKCGDMITRANAAINIMIYGSVETLGPIMEAMRVERDEEARSAMVGAGRALIIRCEEALGPSAIARAERAIDAVEAFQRRAMDLPVRMERMPAPGKDVSGSVTAVLPKKR